MLVLAKHQLGRGEFFGPRQLQTLYLSAAQGGNQVYQLAALSALWELILLVSD